MSREESSDEPIEVFLKGSGADARARMTARSIVVLKGSTGRAADVPSLAEGFRRRRAELISNGTLQVSGESLLVQQDVEFDSPSGAAMTLMGRHANGWREWRTADGTPIDSLRNAPGGAREHSFQVRWFEAHRRLFSQDATWLVQEQGNQEVRDASGRDAVGFLATLESTRDVAAFVGSMQTWAARPENRAFNGFSGQMLLNQLVKHSESAAELADVLADVLRAPGDLAEARRKIQRIADHIEQIRVGAHPAPGHSPFLLSYFWALQDHENWPVIWASAGAFAEFITGRPLPASPAERYSAFVEFMESLEADNDQIEWIAAWWAAVRPVLLDDVLVDRCRFGMEDPPPSVEVRQRNADVLVAIAGHLATRLVDVVSAAAGRSLSAVKPPRGWTGESPRSDFWADWRAVDQGPSIRLWVTHAGAVIGMVPGVVRIGWLEQVAPLIEGSRLPGLQRYDARGSRDDPDRRIVGGRSGEFIYGKWFEPDQLADLDVEAEVTDIAVALRPLMDELVRRATGQDDNGSEDPLATAVTKFREGYPSPKDEQQLADRSEFAATLAADAIALADPMELRRIWNTGRYGSPGPQSNLNTTVRDADAAEYDRIVDTFRYVCWGSGDDQARIDEALDPGGERYVKGLGEAVIMKMLSICHPDRYLPVFPYSGPKGKRRMLQVLGLPEPASDSRGALQVEANDRLRQRLDKFFPGDTWGMAQFLYRYSEGLDIDESEFHEEADPLEQLAEQLLVDRSFLDDIVQLLEDKRQVILYGPPGTGKTYLAQKLAEVLVPDPTRRPLVQFHPSMSYEDFFEGYRPETDPDGALSYRLTPGPLARLAARAADAPGKRHMMIIDEINRANLPRVLGELLFLLEYRDVQVPTLYRPDDPFELPSDIWFIGTMNTADRSIALVDAALRRRFHFVPFFPNHGPMQGLLDRWLNKHGGPVWVGELVAMANDLLTEALGGPHLQIGPSYFMKKKLDRDAVRRIWEYNIEPFIEDQFFGDPAQIERFRFESVLAAYLGSVGVGSLEEFAAASGDPAPSPSADAIEVVEAR